MTEADCELYDQIMQAERERMRADPPAPRTPTEPQTIHFSELPASAPDSPIAVEWNFYRREVGRLIAEGNEGRWVLIKGEKLIGIWETEEAVNAVRVERFLMQPVLMHRIREREPIVRGGGYNRRWH